MSSRRRAATTPSGTRRIWGWSWLGAVGNPGEIWSTGADSTLTAANVGDSTHHRPTRENYLNVNPLWLHAQEVFDLLADFARAPAAASRRSAQTDTSTNGNALPVLRGGDAAPRGAGGTGHAHKCATDSDRDTHGLADGRIVCEQHKPVCGSATRILSQTGHVCGQVRLR